MSNSKKLQVRIDEYDLEYIGERMSYEMVQSEIKRITEEVTQ